MCQRWGHEPNLCGREEGCAALRVALARERRGGRVLGEPVSAKAIATTKATTTMTLMGPCRSPRQPSSTRRSRSALPMTETELRLIAALAIMGLSRIPNRGNRAPAAIGTPSAL